MWWLCECSCGIIKEISGTLLVTGRRTHVDGTSLHAIKSQKVPVNNTTGVRGVERVRGRYIARIVFRKKEYYLGMYSTVEEAALARRAAEDELYASTIAHYEQWKKRADADPVWAEINPVKIFVEKQNGRLRAHFLPELGE